MSWDQSRDLYIDLGSPGGESCRLTVDSDGTAAAVSRNNESFALMQRDAFELRLRFRELVSGAWSVAQLPVDSAIKLAGRDASDPDGDILFLATSFSETGSGDDLHYAGDLNLNTSEIAMALSSGASVSVLIDIEIQDAANAKRSTYRITGTLTKDIYDDAAGAPVFPSLNSRAGTTAIPNGATSVTVDLSGLGLPSAPSQILLTVRAPSASADILLSPVVDDLNVSATGFTAVFPAAAPASGYKLDWVILL